MTPCSEDRPAPVRSVGRRYGLLLPVLLVVALPARVLAASSQAQPEGALWAAASLGTLGAALAACPVAGIRPLEEQSGAMRTALTTGTVVATPIYAVLKTGVALGLSGAAAWMLALTFDPGTARTSLHAGWTGDWWLRPQHATCEEPIRLIVSPRHAAY